MATTGSSAGMSGLGQLGLPPHGLLSQASLDPGFFRISKGQVPTYKHFLNLFLTHTFWYINLNSVSLLLEQVKQWITHHTNTYVWWNAVARRFPTAWQLLICNQQTFSKDAVSWHFMVPVGCDRNTQLFLPNDMMISQLFLFIWTFFFKPNFCRIFFQVSFVTKTSSVSSFGD